MRHRPRAVPGYQGRRYHRSVHHRRSRSNSALVYSIEDGTAKAKREQTIDDPPLPSGGSFNSSLELPSPARIPPVATGESFNSSPGTTTSSAPRILHSVL